MIIENLKTIVSIFASLFFISESTSTLPKPIPQKPISIILTGDVMLGRTVTREALAKKDWTYPFGEVGYTLAQADLTFINLENPIVTNCPAHESGFKFCAPHQMLEGLTKSGIDVATIANNHTRNYGNQGIEETKQYLTQYGIAYTGDENLVIKKVGNTNFGFIGLNYVDFKPQQKDFTLIKNSDSKVDVLIVGVHWGVEYKNTSNSFQRSVARQLIENGADVIAGHHPHWVQDMEMIDGKPVYYSLGNFVFDQMWSEETKKGLAVRLTFNNNILINQEKLPIYMKQWARPSWHN